MLKTILVVAIDISSLVGSIAIALTNWKKYIALFPLRLFPVSIPLLEMATVLPFIVIAFVYYSPAKWGFKIPFYWTVVHIIMFFEVLALF